MTNVPTLADMLARLKTAAQAGKPGEAIFTTTGWSASAFPEHRGPSLAELDAVSGDRPVIVYATLVLPQVMLTEAFLSFLGLGVQAPLASWGTLVTEGSSQIVVYPWLLICPAAVMAAAILSLNFAGERQAR
jgi:hypothetical protein